MGEKPSKHQPESGVPTSEVAIYRTASGVVEVQCLLREETLWLTQKALADLFGVQRPAITKHLRNIFATGELAEEAVCSILEHTAALNRIVSAYLDLAENRAQRGIVMKMSDWVDFLHSFLELSNYPILTDKGKVAMLEAKLKAEQAYEVFRQRQDAEYISDFDKEVKRLKGE